MDQLVGRRRRLAWRVERHNYRGRLCPPGGGRRHRGAGRRRCLAGVRRHTAERRKLRREFVSVQTPRGEVTVKVGRLDGAVLQAAPEYESCRKLAGQSNVPVKVVYEAALRAFPPK